MGKVNRAKPAFLWSSVLVVLAGICNFTGALAASPASAATAIDLSSTIKRYGPFPMRFEPNEGQTHLDVKFLSHRENYNLFLTATDAVLVLLPRIPKAHAKAGVLRMKFLGSDIHASMEGLENLSGSSNYLIGNDQRQWRTDVPGYAKVRYANLYPGIDLVYYAKDEHLECDFVVAPGASPQSIRLELRGADGVHIDGAGDLVMRVRGEEIRLLKPVAYQQAAARSTVPAQFVLLDKYRVGLRIGAYDVQQPLVIDPVLTYSTYLGGSGPDSVSGIAVDSIGNIYITGSTASLDFPTANPLQAAHGSPNVTSCQNRFNGSTPCRNAFVTKISADGSSLLYSTYIGGNSARGGNDDGTGIAVDTAGNAYVTGHALSDNFPTVGNQLGNGHVFVLKLNSTGSALLYSTRFARSGIVDMPTVNPQGIAVDPAGNAYVAGETDDIQFPLVNASGHCTLGSNPFVIRFNATASAILYSTCVLTPPRIGSVPPPGIAWAIAVDRLGNAYITGGSDRPPAANGDSTVDVFACKLNASGKVMYATAWGGSSEDVGAAIAVDSTGNAYIAGWTRSIDFPVMNAVQPALAPARPSGYVPFDAFVTKLNPQGSITYSTYLGGNDLDSASGIAVDDSGNIYVTGYTRSSNFPTENSIQPNLMGTVNAFVSVLNASSSTLLFSTYLGGTGDDRASAVALDPSRNVYVAGSTTSPDFPIVGALQPKYNPGCVPNPDSSRNFCGDAFVSKIGQVSGVGTPGSGSGSTSAVPSTAPLPIADVETGTTRTGYVIITPDPGSSTPLTTLTFGTVRGGIAMSQAAILPTSLTTDSSVQVDAVPGINRNVGVAVANASGTDATITLALRAEDGTPAGDPAQISIPARQQLARFVTELFPAIGAAFRGSLNIQSSVPVSLIGLRFSGAQFSTLPILTSGSAAVPSRILTNGNVGGAGALIFSQFAMSGGWATTLELLNTTSNLMSGRIDIFDSTGNPMAVSLNGATQSTFTYSIPARGSITLAPRDSNGQSPF